MPLLGRREPAPLPFAPGSVEELAARWVRWVAGVGPVRSPIGDTTGGDAGVDQPDDVFFLAGTFGGTVHRRCAVPAGRPLFLPAVNMWQVGDEPAPVLEEGFGHVLVDARPVALEAVATIPFEVAGALLNPVTRSRRAVPVTVWGLWAHVAALDAGTHEVRVEGGDGHGFEVGAVYTLDVAGV